MHVAQKVGSSETVKELETRGGDLMREYKRRESKRGRQVLKKGGEVHILGRGLLRRLRHLEKHLSYWCPKKQRVSCANGTV